MNNKILKLFNIKYPIIQAGMVWCSGWELASAVSNAGGLGIIGSGSMYPEILQEHIRKCKRATTNNFAVNVPLMYPQVEEHMKIIIDEKVPVVFTSAGNPKAWTQTLKDNGIIVVHVVSSEKFAVKSADAGVDAVVAEGFEAGGHNGREETTTMCLIPQVKKAVNIPIIAAGGIGTGAGILAAMALGADAVQIGSRFAATVESSAHVNFKQCILETPEGGTELSLKSLTPVRLIKNDFYKKVSEAEHRCATVDELRELLGRGRAKLGMFEGDLSEGELEIGQIAGLINDLPKASDLVNRLMKEYEEARIKISANSFN